MTKLSRADVDARFLEIKSHPGHYATTEEPEKLLLEAERFLRQLEGS